MRNKSLRSLRRVAGLNKASPTEEGGMKFSHPYIVHRAIFQTENLMVTNKSANRKCFSWRTRAVIMTRSVESFNRETFLFSLITGQKKKKEN